MNPHTCTKCKAKYSDEDKDDYLCPPCNEMRKSIAKEIDAKFANRPKKEVRSEWKELERTGSIMASDNGSKIFIMNRGKK